MKLTIGKWYTLSYFGYSQKIKLLDIPRRNVTHYKWERPDGRIFENREQDVQSWIKLGEIKEKI
jgi:hypothetical protein